MREKRFAGFGGPLVTALLTTTCVLGLGCGNEGKSSGSGAPGAGSAPLSALGQSTKLEGDVVLRVADTRIERSTVLAVARAQHLSAEDAARLLIDEALLAEAARRQSGNEAKDVKQGTTAVLAAAVVTRFREGARAIGPITDAELTTALAAGEEWMDLDRPETRRVVHALVPKDVIGGEALAKSLRDAIASTTTPEEFLAAARGFKSDALPAGKLVVEPLAPFTAEGRVLEHDGGTYALPFTQAAFALAKAGDTSDVIWNPEFGWHVIRLVSIDEPHHAPREQLVRFMEGQIIRARIGTQFEDLVTRLQAAANVQLFADDATMMVPK